MLTTKQLREKLGLSQQQLANILGVTKAQLNNLEQQKSKLPEHATDFYNKLTNECMFDDDFREEQMIQAHEILNPMIKELLSQRIAKLNRKREAVQLQYDTTLNNYLCDVKAYLGMYRAFQISKNASHEDQLRCELNLSMHTKLCRDARFKRLYDQRMKLAWLETEIKISIEFQSFLLTSHMHIVDKNTNNQQINSQ
jgi:transcriptional regulator with XRE-family HTH domain